MLQNLGVKTKGPSWTSQAMLPPESGIPAGITQPNICLLPEKRILQKQRKVESVWGGADNKRVE